MSTHKLNFYRLLRWIIVFLYLLSIVIYFFISWIFIFIAITLIYWIYEIIILPGEGLRKGIEQKLEEYIPTENNLSSLENKIGVGVTTFSTTTGVAFSLVIFLLGFFIISNRQIGLNVDTVIVSISLIALVISGIISLIGLDKYDTAACPSFGADDKWKTRKTAKNYFVYNWYFLIFGIITALSLIDLLLTLIGYTVYTFIHNMYWEQKL